MMTYQPRQPGLTDARGTHYVAGADHLFYSTSGEVFWLPTQPATVLVQRAEQLTRGKLLNLNVFGGADVQWNSTGTQLLALNGARILPLSGVTSLDAIAASTLVEANWASSSTSVSEDGTSAAGRFYAVRITYRPGEYHYAKVRVFSAQAKTWVEWVVFNTSPNPIRVASGYTDIRDIVVSDYETALYFTAQDDAWWGGAYVFHAPRVSNNLNAFPEFTSNYQPLHDGPLEDPQQLAVDGGFIYVVDSTTLWRINVSARMQVPVVEGLSGGTGLLLSVSGASLKAYITDAEGHLYAVEISDFSDDSAPIPLPDPLVTLPGRSGFITWADAEHSALYAPLPDMRELARVNLLTGAVTIEGTTPEDKPEPWSVEVFSENTLYVSCQSEIGQFTRSIAVSGVLMLGIGLIPFDYITNSIQIPASPGPNDGRANTSGAPGYYFSNTPHLPFGGNLSLMVNHELAWNSGIRFFSVKFKNLPSNQTRSIVDTFYDLKWNEAITPPKFTNEPNASNGGLYPIRNPKDLWYNPYLGTVVKTSFNDNGHNLLTVEFFDANKQLVANGSFTRLILVDNTRCNAKLELPRVGTAQAAPAPGVYPTLTCGCLEYGTKNDRLEIDFKAWQPQGSGTYSLRVSKGGVNLPALGMDGNVTMAPTLLTKKDVVQSPAVKPLLVGHILGDCDVANVVMTLNGPSRVIDGFGWVNLGAYDSKSFTLIKGPVSHSTWTPP